MICGKDVAVYMGMLVASITLVTAIVGPQISQGITNDARHDAENKIQDEEIKKLAEKQASDNVGELKKTIESGFTNLNLKMDTITQQNTNILLKICKNHPSDCS